MQTSVLSGGKGERKRPRSAQQVEAHGVYPDRLNLALPSMGSEAAPTLMRRATGAEGVFILSSLPGEQVVAYQSTHQCFNTIVHTVESEWLTSEWLSIPHSKSEMRNDSKSKAS